MALIDRERWLALSPLLDELLEADPNERAVRLEKIRRDDASLGEHLAQLLARQAEVETAQFLEGSVLQQHGAATLVDQVVGSYTLERMLGQGGIKLLDFGVAKLMRDGTQPSGATELTEIGGRAFTPEYAAPEQVQAADVTTATDVYALGVLLHVLLVGAHPTVRGSGTLVEQLRALLETE